MSQVCDDCDGWFMATWHAPDALWAAVYGRQGRGLLCIDCFTKRASRMGIRISWQAEVSQVGDEVQRFKSQRCDQGGWHREGALNQPNPATGT